MKTIATTIATLLALPAVAATATHTVTFRRMNGTVLQRVEVEHGDTAVAPAGPDESANGLTFQRWDGAEKLAFYPDNGDGFLRADWFRDGTGANYIDYSEALSRLAAGGRGGEFAYRRLAGFGAPYFVNPVSVTATCPDALLPVAAECLRILTGKEYMTSVLWPKGKSPAYVLPVRYDIFIDFASRDFAYAHFFHDAALPGNCTWRLPADAKAIILDAATRSR